MLFDPQRHEPLSATRWSEEKARATIQAIVTECIDAYRGVELYAAHPRDEPNGAHMGSAYYFGAGGVLWAVDYLRRQGAARADPDWIVARLTENVSSEELEPDGPVRGDVSYLFGDLPLILHLAALTGDESWRARAVRRIHESVAAPARELMWGTPGVLIGTRLIGDPVLADAVEAYDRANIDKLFAAWNVEEHGLTVWKEELYGNHHIFVGPVHGFAGQVLPLLQRLDELETERRNTVLERAKAFLLGTALRDGELANWPPLLPPEGTTVTGATPLVQYCHGAPGMVISFCEFPAGDSEVDALLFAGGELAWHAGPLVKGSNLCHGTGGNGYAFLKLYRRTGDATWLERARQFAMHGIDQYQAELERVGHGRFSLWTGDPGFAVYLWACITSDASFPTVDVF